MPKGIKTSPKQAEINLRRSKVAEMYLSGIRQQQIGKTLGVDQATISRDLKALQAVWMQSAVLDLAAAKGRELARIDVLEREYWKEWRRSKKKTKSTSKRLVETDSDKNPSTKREASDRETERLGDPRYLEGIQWCIEQRSKIIGMNAAGQNFNIDMSLLNEEQLRRVAAGENILIVLATSGSSRTGTQEAESGEDNESSEDLDS